MNAERRVSAVSLRCDYEGKAKSRVAWRGVASLSTLKSRSRCLLQCLASITAASGRDDYGRA
eukprot:3849076-Pleurochrysis_carterae.AAC.1